MRSNRDDLKEVGVSRSMPTSISNEGSDSPLFSRESVSRTGNGEGSSEISERALLHPAFPKHVAHSRDHIGRCDCIASMKPGQSRRKYTSSPAALGVDRQHFRRLTVAQ